ncbi:MAG TPA: glycerol kinase GlpK [Vicinamibacteria bacterium]|nr:glycerol kinase GlpK [Vicinamibacteria bacterium]
MASRPAAAVVALDQGTTGSTSLVFGPEGEVLGRAYGEITQHYPAPGFVEHDAEEIWTTSLRVLRQAIAASGVPPLGIRAIGITNQRETTVLWDRRTGDPVHRAIVWQSRQSAGVCARLKAAGHEPLFHERTGLVLDPYFSGSKIAWLLERDPALRARAEAGELAFGTIDSWLVHRLTGGRTHVTDPTNASRTLLYDIHARRWDAELCGVLGVPQAMLPEVRPSSGVFAETAALDGLPAGIPLAGMAGDQQAALFGQGCFEAGMAKNTYGTGAFLVLNTGERRVISRRGLLTTLCCDARGQAAYALEGSVFIAGAAVQWLRDELGLVKTASETAPLAGSVPDTAGVYVVPAFVGLGAPYWDADARGAIVGLTRGASRAHLVRATLESLAYQSRDVIDAMNEESGVPLRELRVDGGASANDFLMQFQADLLGVPVDRPALVETTAAGAAFLAGLGTGFWRDAQELARTRRRDRLFTPALSPARRQELYAGWQAAVGRVLSRQPIPATSRSTS